MSPAITIRTAQRGEARAIAEVHVRTWQVAYAGQLPPEFLASLSIERSEAMWAQVIESRAAEPGPGSGCRLFVAVEGSGPGARIIGFLDLARDDAGDAEVRALYVRPGHWSEGTGGRLLRAALGEAASSGANACVLAVLSGNAAGRRFYERHGFRFAREERERIGEGVEVDHAYYRLEPITEPPIDLLRTPEGAPTR